MGGKEAEAEEVAKEVVLVAVVPQRAVAAVALWLLRAVEEEPISQGILLRATPKAIFLACTLVKKEPNRCSIY